MSIPEVAASLPTQELAKFHVMMWMKANLEWAQYKKIRGNDVIVVWFCKTLQNWKALVTTTLPNGLYFEVTYDGDKHVTYLDSYKKQDQVVILDD